MTQTKTISLAEVKKHNTRESVWFVIENKVYDVTKFMEEHPGGEEVLIEQAGQNASEIFHDVSHSADAKDLMENYLIGELPAEERVSEVNRLKRQTLGDSGRNFADHDTSLSLTWGQWIVTLAVSAGVGLLVRSWLS